MKTQEMEVQEEKNQGIKRQSLTGGVVSVVVPYTIQFTIQFLGLLFGGIARSLKRL